MLCKLVHRNIGSLIDKFSSYETKNWLEHKQRQHAVLTLLSRALEIERAAIIHVNKRVGLFDVLYAKGGFNEQEHKANLKKIKGTSFIRMLKNYSPKNDVRLNMARMGFKERIDKNSTDILNEIIKSKKILIADPKQSDLNLPANEALFRLYSAEGKDYSSFILAPLIGTDNEVYMILGGSNCFSRRGLDEIVGMTKKLNSLYNTISTTLQKERAYEKGNVRKEALEEIREVIIHHIRNPLASFGGFLERLKKTKDIPGEFEKIHNLLEETLLPNFEEHISYIKDVVDEVLEGDIVYINDVVEKVARESAYREKLELELDKRIPYVKENSYLISDAISNLVHVMMLGNGNSPIQIITEPKINIKELHREGVYLRLVSNGNSKKKDLVERVKKICNGFVDPTEISDESIKKKDRTYIDVCNGGNLLVEQKRESTKIELYIPRFNYS